MVEKKVIIATHGDFAAGIQNSVKMVVGSLADEIEVYGLYPGAAPADYTAELEERIRSEPQIQYVILTDIYGASVCTAMCPLTRFENVVLFTGMNLPMLINLLISFPGVLDENAVQSLIQEAKDGVKTIRLNFNESDDNDF